MRSLVLIFFALAAHAAWAQLVTNPAAVPRTGSSPVVFLNGYQSDCNGITFASTFGRADEVLQRAGRASLFFNNCSIANRPSIEELGNAFGQFVSSLRYTDGQPVEQVDAVAHSMGGLILRSYLAGKQTEAGVFRPPIDTLVRKAVFLGTPHFGTPIVSLGSSDAQTRELAFGSQFIYELGTWNQGTDDLRGVDAIAVLGDAGTISIGTGWPSRFHDSTVSLMSASLRFAREAGNTRVLPYCHTGGIASLACSGGAPLLANIPNEQHDTARILLSFLSGTSDWRSIGGDSTFLRDNAGLLLGLQDKDGRAQAVRAASGANLAVRSDLASTELVRAGAQEVVLNLTERFTVDAAAGAVRALTLKPGPWIAAVVPALGYGVPRSRAVAAQSYVSIYGRNLENAQVSISGTNLELLYSSAGQINALLPDGLSGIVRITLRNAAGEHTVNLMVEPTAVSVHPVVVRVAADYITIYATGMGATERRADGLNWLLAQPEVTVGGQACAVTYAGRTPEFPGLDQINCRLPEGLTGEQPVVVRQRGIDALPVRIAL